MRHAALFGSALAVAAGLVIAFMPKSLAPPGLACPAQVRPLAQLELIFGTQRKGATPIEEREWGEFVAAEITPRFPQGLTVLTGFGLWHDAQGMLVSETSRLLLVWYEPAAGMDARIEAIRSAYKARFGQQSVPRADGMACVSF